MTVTPSPATGASSGGTPRVSVVVPFLDVARYLEEAVESVLAQTYTSWELLLIDDGSTDGSTDLALGYVARHPDRVRYLEHPGHRNAGLNYSRTVGVREARGELVALLDGDDVWLPHKLDEQVALLDAHPEAAMLYSNTLYWFSWTGAAADRERDFTIPLGVEGPAVMHPPALFARMLRQDVAVPCTCSILARRDAIIRLDGFGENWPNHTDQTFYARMLLAEPVVVVDHVWDCYRRHDESICARLDAANGSEAARLRYLLWVADYLRRTGHTDPGVRAALRAAIRKIRHPRMHRAWRRARHVARRLSERIRGAP